MCGIAGFAQLGKSADEMRLTVSQMVDRLFHRGPDDAGIWVDAEAGLALGHRRLSIIDLSAAGKQPMRSYCGRYILVFNGEIYNHLDLRHELDQKWRGHSDTETLLAGIVEWGLENMLKRCVGMFAIALWDQHTKILSLARDRFGEKPLYYGWIDCGGNSAFVFGSELKALKSLPKFKPNISREALSHYFRFNYIPAPYSIYEAVFKLEPGCLLSVKCQHLSRVPLLPPRIGQTNSYASLIQWWSVSNSIINGLENQLSDQIEALNLLEEHLIKAVSQQSLADVPLGAFLSGGIDSTTITALLQRNSSRSVKTFTIGFDDTSFDESKYALSIARHLGTEHHEMRVTAQMAWEVIPLISQIYDEPFADSSQIPTYLVCKAARQDVTVALSGDGGDELFGGYNRYFLGPRVWKQLGWLPYNFRRQLGSFICSIPISTLNALSGMTGVSRFGDKAQKFAQKLSISGSIDDLYWSLVSEWTDTENLVLGGVDHFSNSAFEISNQQEAILALSNPAERMMVHDTLTYLPDDILCKVDRAAMAMSLETRVPFLDHRVFDLAWRLPINMKIRGNISKWALRQVLYKYVPPELIERPKQGFSMPIGEWIRGPLRDWAEELLSERSLQRLGYLNTTPIRQKWAEHMRGQVDHSAGLWSVLMFQSWLLAQDRV